MCEKMTFDGVQIFDLFDGHLAKRDLLFHLLALHTKRAHHAGPDRIQLDIPDHQQQGQHRKSNRESRPSVHHGGCKFGG